MANVIGKANALAYRHLLPFFQVKTFASSWVSWQLRRQVALVLLHLAGKYVPKNPTALVVPESSMMLKDTEIVSSNVMIKILTRISKC